VCFADYRLSGIPRRNYFTPIFIKIGDIVSWDLLKFRVVFDIQPQITADKSRSMQINNTSDVKSKSN
jgi:hypothetical protein